MDSLRISRLWIKFAFNQLVAETMTKPSLGMGFFYGITKTPIDLFGYLKPLS